MPRFHCQNCKAVPPKNAFSHSKARFSPIGIQFKASINGRQNGKDITDVLRQTRRPPFWDLELASTICYAGNRMREYDRGISQQTAKVP